MNPTTGSPILVPNTDGFDPESTSNVLLEDSYFAVNDDAAALKAGWDCAGYDLGIPTENVTIRNIVVWRGGGGISLGSEMSGGISNVYVENVLLQYGSYGIQVKTGDTRGGYVKNVVFNNFTIVGTLKKAVCIDAFYGSPNPFCGDPAPVVPTQLDGILVSNVVTRASNLSLHLVGLEAAPTANVRLVNVTFNDKSLADCQGNVWGTYENVSPMPPVECGLEEEVKNFLKRNQRLVFCN